MNPVSRFFGVILATVLFPCVAQAQEQVRFDFFSAGADGRPNVEYSVTLDGNTGTLETYAPDPWFSDISAHSVLKIDGTIVLDAIGLAGPAIGTDEGISYFSLGVSGVGAAFYSSPNNGPDNNYTIPGPWPTTPSQFHLVVNPGVYFPESYSPYFKESGIGYNSVTYPLTQLTVTLVPEPSAAVIGATTIGLLARRRHVR